jgi:hypothetical protein
LIFAVKDLEELLEKKARRQNGELEQQPSQGDVIEATSNGK